MVPGQLAIYLLFRVGSVQCARDGICAGRFYLNDVILKKEIKILNTPRRTADVLGCNFFDFFSALGDILFRDTFWHINNTIL